MLSLHDNKKKKALPCGALLIAAQELCACCITAIQNIATKVNSRQNPATARLVPTYTLATQIKHAGISYTAMNNYIICINTWTVTGRNKVHKLFFKCSTCIDNQCVDSV